MGECPNCDIEMDLVETASGERMVMCGICSFGFPAKEQSPMLNLAGIWKGDDLQECMDGGRAMTEQEYMKLVTYHQQKQKEAEDEAYILWKEIERLRKALEEIEDEYYMGNMDARKMYSIARKALKGKTK